MQPEQILKILHNAGFHNLHLQGGHTIIMEDPSCVLRSFVVFVEYAWIVICIITGLMIFGWGVSLIRGSGYKKIFVNMRNLFLIFGVISLAGPVLKFMFGDDLFKHGCKTISISVDDVQQMLDMRKAKLAVQNADLYEVLDIYFDGQFPTDNAEYPDAVPQIPELTTESGNAGGTADDNAFGGLGGGTGSGARPVSASGHGKNVDYHYQTYTLRRSDGTRAWRNNNPGNIRPGKSIRALSVGQAGGFMVFPDENTGMQAIVTLLKTNMYQQKTLGQAIYTWAPPSDGNNTGKYQRNVEQATGVPLNTPMRNLNDAQLWKLATVIRSVEGWGPGQESRLEGNN